MQMLLEVKGTFYIIACVEIWQPWLSTLTFENVIYNGSKTNKGVPQKSVFIND